MMQPPSETASTGSAKSRSISLRFIGFLHFARCALHRVIRPDNAGDARTFREFNEGIATTVEALSRPAPSLLIALAEFPTPAFHRQPIDRGRIGIGRDRARCASLRQLPNVGGKGGADRMKRLMAVQPFWRAIARR